ncbi:hypothetical protein DV737_g5214, partial [Chaetothyriales sp. CBS 132003]
MAEAARAAGGARGATRAEGPEAAPTRVASSRDGVAMRNGTYFEAVTGVQAAAPSPVASAAVTGGHRRPQAQLQRRSRFGLAWLLSERASKSSLPPPIISCHPVAVATMGVPFESLIPYAIMFAMFGVTGAGLATTKLIANNGKRPRWNMDVWDRQMIQRDYRLTGVFREQTDAVEAPVGFEVSSRWKLEDRISPKSPSEESRQFEVGQKKPVPALLAFATHDENVPSATVDAKEGYVDGINYRLYTPMEVAKASQLPVGTWTVKIWTLMTFSAVVAFSAMITTLLLSMLPPLSSMSTIAWPPESKFPIQLINILSVFKWAHHLVMGPTKRDNIKGVVAIVPITLHFDYVPNHYKGIYTSCQ